MYRSAATRPVLGVVSAVMAAGVMALVGPSPAMAKADGVDWDAVAACESGGDWTADTGNGRYGGLQFKPATWKEFGGTGSPAQASRAEQIAVANRVLAAQGPGAWPKCGPGKVRGPKAPPQTTGTERAVRDLIKTLWSTLPD